MDNLAIEKLLIEIIDLYLKTNKKNSLSFIDNKKFTVFWDNNNWFLSSREADPISLVIFEKNPERCKVGDDDYIIATISKILDKPAWWVRSFQHGWYDRPNNSMSISGYLLGRKLRKKHFK